MQKTLSIKLARKNPYADAQAFSLLGLALCFNALSYSVKVVAMRMDVQFLQSFFSLAVYFVWFLSLLYFALNNISKIKYIILWEVVFFLLLLVNYLHFPDSRTYYGENALILRQLAIVYIPIAAVCSQIEDFSCFFDHICKYVWVSNILLIFSWFLGFVHFMDYQVLGTCLSPLILMLFARYMNQRKRSYLLLFCIDCIMIFFAGRQSLFVVAIGMILIYVLLNSDKITKLIGFICGGAVIVLVVFLFSEQLLSLLIDVMELFNLESRTLTMLINGELTDASNRTFIYESAIEIIEKNGNKISGLFADRYYLEQYRSWIVYSHNIFLEFFIDFGIIGGAIISILFVVSVIKKLLSGSATRKVCVAIVFSISFVRLFVSSSFIVEGSFYILLGLLANRMKQNKDIVRGDI